MIFWLSRHKPWVLLLPPPPSRVFFATSKVRSFNSPYGWQKKKNCLTQLLSHLIALLPLVFLAPIYILIKFNTVKDLKLK